MISFRYSELSTPLPTFTGVVDLGNNVYESDAPTLVPALSDISEFDVNSFLYWKFGFTNDGAGTTEWKAEDYDYGMKEEKRTGIGSFYFYPASFGSYDMATPWFIPPATPFSPTGLPDPLGCPDKIDYWSWLSTFFNVLIPDHRKMIEWIWSAMQDVGCEYTKKARRFIESLNPEASLINPTENFYDIKIDVLSAYPIYLDPQYQNYKITALKYLTYPNQTYSDIFVTEEVYKILRDICIDSYVVIPATEEGKDDRYFKIIDRKSTIESKGDPAMFTVKGDSVLYPDSFIKFTADDPNEDISQYKIGFFSAVGPNETYDIDWVEGPDKILRVICYAQLPNGSSILVNIDDLVNAINAADPNKWCTASNVSGPTIELPPLWGDFIDWNSQSKLVSDISYENIVSYTPNEGDSGSWTPPEGMKWVPYPGYSYGGTREPGVNGDYADDRNKYRHFLRVLGDLSYLQNNLTPQFYTTTGKKFQVDNYVIDLPILTPHITKEVPFYVKDRDYTFYNNFVEFYEDPKIITTDVDILYGPKIDVIEYFLYELYGKLCHIDWEDYNYNNVTGKEAVRTLMQTLQSLSTRYDFDRSSNVYGGLPLSPYNGRVIGMYESYDYKIKSIDEGSNTITLDIPENEKLHFFFIEGSVILINDRFESPISNIDHDLATMEVSEISRFKVGDNINIKLPTNFKVKIMHDTETSGHETPCIHILAPLDFAELIKTYADLYEELTNERPELIVWNQDNLNGVYHIMDSYVFVSETPGESDVVIQYYNAEGTRTDLDSLYTYNARYNDYWRSGEGETALAHFKWATHKFLLIYDPETQQPYRAYIDAPMDTILSTDQAVEKGDVLCRNINIFDSNEFKNFTEFNKFIGINSTNNHNKVLMVSGMPVKYGWHFPGKEKEQLLS